MSINVINRFIVPVNRTLLIHVDIAFLLFALILTVVGCGKYKKEEELTFQ